MKKNFEFSKFFFFYMPFCYETNFATSQLSLMFRLLSQTVTFRSVTPFPLKVLRLSGTPESPPDFLGKRKSKETERQFCRIGKTKRVDFALTKYAFGYPKAYGFGSVCPF